MSRGKSKYRIGVCFLLLIWWIIRKKTKKKILKKTKRTLKKFLKNPLKNPKKTLLLLKKLKKFWAIPKRKIVEKSLKNRKSFKNPIRKLKNPLKKI